MANMSKFPKAKMASAKFALIGKKLIKLRELKKAKHLKSTSVSLKSGKIASKKPMILLMTLKTPFTKSMSVEKTN
jgi:hypothetical protein